ncbi:MFS transporter [Rhizobium sp. XQZ8]|uniref:MFS transporter n=1 Tax=Rhizobium populisoli TaxID=2859785 RepID=UPI001C667D67|nr:MFS transporter [Rhizobium populisoli]MBW6424891.1 MFS transporter [Rhizobium populisoli]
MKMTERPSMLSPFGVRNYRFQWSSDLMTSCATEMETIILGWFIFIETSSVPLLTLFASLQYFGTLIAPAFGLAGDRLGHRNVILCMRTTYALLAVVIAVLALTCTLSPLSALVIAGLAGLLRPSDMGMRNVLTTRMVAGDRLMSAISLSRITTDSARIVGALTGASVVALLGIQWAYPFIVVFYLASAALMVSIHQPSSKPPAGGVVLPFTPVKDFIDALRALGNSPPHLAAMLLAFLVNLMAFPFTLGLLPYIAREVYQAGHAGLGYLTAATGVGALAASLLLGHLGHSVRPARMMLIFGAVWHCLVLLLGQTESMLIGLVVLAMIGAASILCLLPLSVLLLRGVHPDLLGRIMGIRMQAVYGLPIGLLVSGPLIDSVGFSWAATLYGGLGLILTGMIGGHWFPHLWPASVVSNQG